MRITVIHAHNPGPYTGDGNNTYLLDDNAEAILIDAGTGHPDHLDDLATALERHRVRLGAVAVTHGHPDHASGAEALAQRWPGVNFFKMPWPDRDSRYAVRWTPLADGDRIAIGRDAIEAVHTPGHAPDHLAFWHEGTRVLFAGDLVTQQGTVVIPASHGGSLTQYLAALQRVLRLAPSRILPAHGPIVEDPHAVLERYIDHRAHREQQILAAVRSGCSTLEAIVDNVYDGLVEALKGAARDSVLAHLVKLEQDGAVLRQGNDWRAR